MLYIMLFVMSFFTTVSPSSFGSATTAVVKPELTKKSSKVLSVLPSELSNIVQEYYGIEPNQPELKKLWFSERDVPGKECNCDVSKNGQTLLVVSCASSHASCNSSIAYIYKLEHGQWEHVDDKIIDFSAQPSILAATVSTVIDRRFSFTFDEAEQEWQSSRLSFLDNKEGTISGNGTIMAWESYQDRVTVTVRTLDGRSVSYVLPRGLTRLQTISFDGNYVVMSDRNKEQYAIIHLMGNSTFKTCELFTKNTRPFTETVRCINISQNNNYLLVGSGHGKWALYARNTSAETPNCWVFAYNFNIGNNGYMTFNTNANIVAALTLLPDGFEVSFYKENKGEWQKKFFCKIKSPSVEILRQSNSSGYISLRNRISVNSCVIHIIDTNALYDIFNLDLDQLFFLDSLYKKNEQSPGSSLVLDTQETIELNGLSSTLKNKLLDVYNLQKNEQPVATTESNHTTQKPDKNKKEKPEELCVIS